MKDEPSLMGEILWSFYNVRKESSSTGIKRFEIGNSEEVEDISCNIIFFFFFFVQESAMKESASILNQEYRFLYFLIAAF